MYVRHVRNLVLENFVFRLRAPDARPAIVLDDCHDVRLTNFNLDAPTHGQPLLRLKQSSNVTISGYQSIEPLPSFLVVEGEASRDIKLAGNDFSRVREVVELRDGAKLSAVRLMNNFK
jgi:hypothetical protein